MKAAIAICCAVPLGVALAGGGPPQPASPSIVSELSGYTRTSRYEDVIRFLEAIARAHPGVHLTTFGTTTEQRALPLAVIGAAAATPEAVRATGKLRVYIQGNIHGGEVEGKESAQKLVRELAAGRHEDWLRRMVLLVAPIYNADGNERIALNTRGPQYGPMEGQGQRPNAQGLDLNRDHMKLDSPEARAFAKLLHDYDPHVTIDLHTTNGTHHGYHLTYAPPLHPATDEGIAAFLRREWLPAVTRAVQDKYNWAFYFYGNLPEDEGRPAPAAGLRHWETFDHRPRFNNNYVGLRNRAALLSEAYAYLTFEDRILATDRFLDETLTFAAAHADRIKTITAAADAARLPGRRLPLQAELQAGEIVDILLGDVREVRHPVDGHLMYLRAPVTRREKMIDYGRFRGTVEERVPSTYYLPSSLKEAAGRLAAHGVRVSPLASAIAGTFEEFAIQTSETAPTPFQQHRERRLTGAWRRVERTLPAGTLRVDMSQPLARLAFYLLEPRSDDGLADWNLLDEALEGATVYPIVRSGD